MNKVFVYGTLRKGWGNHRIIEGAELLGVYTVKLPFRMKHLGGFPGLTQSKMFNTIIGEVYAVTDRMMESMDCLEGYPDFYNRELIDVHGHQCWVYYLADSMHYNATPNISNGDWNNPMYEEVLQ